MSDSHGASFLPGHKNVSADCPSEPCSGVELEVEFFNCWNEERIKSSMKVLNELPQHVSIYSQDAAHLYVIGVNKTHNQYINLPRKDKWRGFDPDKDPQRDRVFAVDRTGDCPRILVRLKHLKEGGAAKLSRKVKVVLEAEGANNIAYNDQIVPGNKSKDPESKRLGGDLRLETEVRTSGSGYVVIDGKINLATLAGNKYRIKAFVSDDPSIAASSKGVIETWRYMWVEKILCGDGQWKPQNDPFACMKDVIDVYKTCFVRIDDSGEVIPKKEYEFLDRTPPNNKTARSWRDKATKKSDKHPYVASIACSRMMGHIKNDMAIKRNVIAGSGSTLEEVFFKDLVACYKNSISKNIKNDTQYLECFFNGRKIDNAYIDYVGRSNNASNGVDNYFLATHIVVDMRKVQAIPRNKSDKNETGDLVVYTKIIDYENRASGFAWQGTNYIWISSEYHWCNEQNPYLKTVVDNTQSDAIKNIIVHELGHMLGLMPLGDSKKPDRTQNTYGKVAINTDLVLSQHKEYHCKAGYQMSFVGGPKITSNAPVYQNIETDLHGNVQSYTPGTCAMYGSTESSAFCQSCKEALRKLSSKKGWAK